MAFVLENAFDSVNRNKLFVMLRNKRIRRGLRTGRRIMANKPKD